jgi:Tfp pilus assembly protein PilO
VTRLNFSQWTFRRIDIASSALCVVGAILFYWLSISPILREQDSLSVRQAYLETQRENTARLTQRAAAIQTRLGQMNDALAKIPIRLEAVHRMNDRISRLTVLATGSGLTIHQIEPGDIDQGPKHTTVPIRLVGKGTYKAWATFLHDLTGRFPDTAVKAFELAGDPSTPASAAQFQIHLLWYAAPSRVAAGK